jgi:hypothetical protein
MCLPTGAWAWGAFGPETCANGFVWRGACRPNDHVCVAPAVASQAAADNSAAASRRVGGAFGPDTCANGFVWRQACGPQDHVCVTPATQQQAATDNQWIPNLGLRNVVYVATRANWVYAFDADNLSTDPSAGLMEDTANASGEHADSSTKCRHVERDDVSACGVAPTGQRAAFRHFYLEAQLGLNSASVTPPSGTPQAGSGCGILGCTADKVVVGGRIGYYWNRYFATEVGYLNFGQHSYGGGLFAPGALRWSGAVIDLLAEYPLGHRFSLYGRVGALDAQLRATESGVYVSTNTAVTSYRSWSGWTAGYGVGVGWRVSGRFELRGGWDGYGSLGQASGDSTSLARQTGRIDQSNVTSLTFRLRF